MISYTNPKACSNCLNKNRCTTAKRGRKVSRKPNEEFVDIVNRRIKENQAKYHQRQERMEHVFGTLKRSMNFTHFLLRGFQKATGEISMTFFSYNLKRVINIPGAANNSSI